MTEANDINQFSMDDNTSAASPVAAKDSPTALEQTTHADNKSDQVLDAIQKLTQLFQTLQEGQNTTAKTVESIALDVAHIRENGVPATLSD